MLEVNRTARALLLAGAALIASRAALAQDSDSPADPGAESLPQTIRTDSGAIIVTARNYVPDGVVTANKAAIPLIETPQSVSVITRDQIDLLNYIDAQQAVRYTAGVFGESYGPDPRYDFVTVRGFSPKAYIDGLAVPASTTIPTTGVDLYAFQSLDILKGPSSALYGLAPPGGILNETSRRPASVFGGEIEGKYGSEDFAELAGTVTGPVSPWLDARYTGLYRDSGTEVNHARARRQLASPAATIKLDDRTRLTALLYYQYDELKGGAGGFLPVYGTLLPSPTGRQISRSTNLDDPSDLFVRRQYGIGYDFEHDLSDAVTIHSNTKWSHYHEETPIGLYSAGGYLNISDPSLPDYYRTVGQSNFSYEETVRGFATDNRINATIRSGPVQHKLLIGVDYRNVANHANYGFAGAATLDVFAPVYDPAFQHEIGYPTRYAQEELTQTGVYAQDQIGIGGLYLLAGGRYDWVDVQSATPYTAASSPPVYTGQQEHKFTYRLGANYVTAAGIAPYLSYATSFEPVLGSDAVTGRAFKPSAVRQWEGGVKIDGRGLPPGVKLFATLAGFDIRETNFVAAQVGSTPIGGVQGGAVEVYGAEAELVARIHDRLSINASYSYIHSAVTSSPNAPQDIGAPMPTTPRHKASAFADYSWQRGALAGFGIGAGVRYTSESAGALPSTTYPALVPGQAIMAGEATLVDAIVHYAIPGWRFAVNGSNIFDKRYVARCSGLYGCVYGAGRQVIGTVTKTF